ncbi:MAG TPA: TetR/AcrR family transcriptional regulator [Eoetvoesiella sp.]|uniref:TetR/AcrR family transcriptional regulator n=1 Tax=Eoetvoesiella sp. TaxID=1966355 RepID=UPI002BE26E69|nr:TetR/AcrR family transcriptional regulator [Eoetvoesiella sp.]HWK60246.1 TetR/AcrR family transcriptional regulator [Eoetvoesiella sp.]
MTARDDEQQASGIASTPDITVATEKKPRPRSAKTTRGNILRAAKKIFSKDGYDGARVDKISKAAKSYDSLIYYYFGSKEKLFVEVLEAAYKDIFEAEQKLPLDLSDPVASLRKIVEFPFRYYLANPEIIVLLGTENLHKGKHIAKSKTADQYARPAIAILKQVVQRGIEMGKFRNDVDCEKLYIAMTSLGYFYVSNRYTFSSFLNTDLMEQGNVDAWAGYVSDLLLKSVLK